MGKIPDGYPTISPYFVVRDAVAAMAFYKQVFGAEEFRTDRDANGKINNVELRVGTSVIMIGESPNAPTPAEGMPLVGMYAYFEDIDVVFERGVAAGAKVLSPPKDQPYGDRRADIVDPSGVVWWIAARIEEAAPDEVQHRTANAQQP